MTRVIQSGSCTDPSPAIADLTARYPEVPVHEVVQHGRPAAVLLRCTMAGLIPAVLQLIVVGSHGRGWFAALLSGSTGRALIRSPACPVAVTR